MADCQGVDLYDLYVVDSNLSLSIETDNQVFSHI